MKPEVDFFGLELHNFSEDILTLVSIILFRG